MTQTYPYTSHKRRATSRDVPIHRGRSETVTSSILDISTRRGVRDARSRECSRDADHPFEYFSEAYHRTHPWKDEWQRERSGHAGIL